MNAGLRRLGARVNDSRWGGAALRRLPQPVLAKLAGLAGGRLPEPVELDVLDRIAERDHAWLADPQNLERTLLPALGFSDDVPFVYPDVLQSAVGRGLRHWQYPNQFAPYLAELATRKVRSYLEIGVRHGGTFMITVDYLSRFTPIERAIAVDLDIVPSMKTFAAGRLGVAAARMDSRSGAFARLVRRQGPFDLVLIDGNHAYEAVKHDLETVLPHARMVALHDIVDDASVGVRAARSELQTEHAKTHEFHEYATQYEEVVERIGNTVLGIGLAIRLPGA